MKPDEFTSLKKKRPPKNSWVVVTNNLKASNAMGEMSHVWLTNFVQFHDGQYLTFDNANRRIENLTHWKFA